MLHTLSTIVLMITVTFNSTHSYACTVFAGKNTFGYYFVGKNFDWLNPDGYLVRNDRHILRNSFFKNANFSWKSKWSSASFTSIGPGLPISGMNEKGLVIEALVDHSYNGSMQERNGLSTLEWVQYGLDTFSNIEELIQFSQDNPFVQLAVALHVFACDREGKCAVFELDSDGEIIVTSGEKLASKTLSNRKWQIDYQRAKSSSKIAKWLTPNFRSHKRFARLMNTQRKPLTLQQTFGALDQSKIDSMIQWQIVWNQKNQTVAWRVFNDRKPGLIRSIDLKRIWSNCGSNTRVIDLKGRSIQWNKSFDKVSKIKIRENLRTVLEWRLGQSSRVFEKKVVDHVSNQKCQLD